MLKVFASFLILILYINTLFGQFYSVDVTIDDRLLRSDEKHDLVNLKSDIKNFFINTIWDDNYNDLGINLHVQLIFEGITQKGNESIYNCQALFSNGRDLRYFDKSVQFFYNSGRNLYYDPVLFEPITSFLAYYAHLILAGEIDTYEFNGGNNSLEISRDIALRGSSSDYKKGWGTRISLVDDLNRNMGLRKARLAWYLALDLLRDGNIDQVIQELNIMLDGLEKSFQDVGRDSHTQYFLKINSKEIANVLEKLGQVNLLKDMKSLDPDRMDFYQESIESISE
tara:strand:+ start:105 stop:953 length:849 start_codon:yes stop_codon:yes gene_type:complete